MDLNILVSTLSQASLLYDVSSFLGRWTTIDLSHVDKSIHQALQVEIRAHYWYPYPICSGYECRIRHLSEAFGSSEDLEVEPVRPIRKRADSDQTSSDRTIRRRIRGKCSLESIIRADHQRYLADIYDTVQMNLQIFLVDRSLIALAHVNGMIHWALQSPLRRIREDWMFRRSNASDQDQVIPANLCTGYELRARYLQRIAVSRPNPRKRIRGKGNQGSGHQNDH